MTAIRFQRPSPSKVQIELYTGHTLSLEHNPSGRWVQHNLDEPIFVGEGHSVIAAVIKALEHVPPFEESYGWDYSFQAGMLVGMMHYQRTYV